MLPEAIFGPLCRRLHHPLGQVLALIRLDPSAGAGADGEEQQGDDFHEQQGIVVQNALRRNRGAHQRRDEAAGGGAEVVVGSDGARHRR